MKIDWRGLGQERRKWLERGWLITAILIAFHSGVIRPSRVFRGIASERSTGLASIERNRHWLVPLGESVDDDKLAAGVLGAVPGRVPSPSAQMMTSESQGLSNGKLIATSSIDLLVQHPAEVAEKIRSLTARVGGFLVKSQSNGAQDAKNVFFTIRVPVARFDVLTKWEPKFASWPCAWKANKWRRRM